MMQDLDWALEIFATIRSPAAHTTLDCLYASKCG